MGVAVVVAFLVTVGVCLGAKRFFVAATLAKNYARGVPGACVGGTVCVFGR